MNQEHKSTNKATIHMRNGNILSSAWRDNYMGGQDKTLIVEVSYASTVPVPRRYGSEVLDVSPGSVRLERANSGAMSVMLDHSGKISDVVGLVLQADEKSAIIAISQRDDLDWFRQDLVAGVYRNISVGYRIYDIEEKTEGPDSDTLVTVTDWEPVEISFVAVPADPTTKVENLYNSETMEKTLTMKSKKQKPEGIDMSKGYQTRDVLPDQGAEPTDSQKQAESTDTHHQEDRPPVEPDEQILAGPTQRPSFAASHKAADEPERAGSSAATSTDDGDSRKMVEQERERTLGLCALRHYPGVKEADINGWIADGVTPATALNQAIARLADEDAATSTRARISMDGPSEWEKRRDAMQAYLLHRAYPESNELPEHARKYYGMSIVELAREILGRRHSEGINRHEIISRAISGFNETTSTLVNLLENIAGKTLRMSYDNTPRTFLPFCRRTSVPDFKEISRVSLSNAPSLELVDEAGEFTHGSFVDSAEKYRILTYGKIVSITRQALVNDDLDGLTRVPQKMGAAAARLENRLIYDLLTDQNTKIGEIALFNTGDPWENAIADATLNVESLANIREIMRSHTDPSGEDILNLEPRYMVVPAALEIKALRLVADVMPINQDDVNPYSRTFKVITEGYLDSKGSGTYYMFADTGQIDTIEYAYLDGQDGPYMDTNVGFNRDGVEFKVRHDFGAAVIDYRGIFKATEPITP